MYVCGGGWGDKCGRASSPPQTSSGQAERPSAPAPGSSSSSSSMPFVEPEAPPNREELIRTFELQKRLRDILIILLCPSCLLSIFNLQSGGSGAATCSKGFVFCKIFESSIGHWKLYCSCYASTRGPGEPSE